MEKKNQGEKTEKVDTNIMNRIKEIEEDTISCLEDTIEGIVQQYKKC